MTSTRTLTVTLLLLAGLGTAAADESASRSISARDVSVLAEEALAAEVATARVHVRTIERAAGIEASDALLRIAQRGPQGVRPEALRALGRLGIRTTDALTYVRGRAGSALDTGERAAALEALGGLVSRPDDVDLILRHLGADEGAERSAAYRALCRISGQRLPASPRRIEGWWSRQLKRMRPTVTPALQGVAEVVGRAPSDETAAQLASYRTTISRYGYMELDAVQDAVTEWLRSSSKALRSEAFKVIAALRLGDFADAVRSASRSRTHVEGLDAACAALDITT